MVTSVEWRPKMSPDETLFPDWMTLREEPLPEAKPDERRDAAWKAAKTTFPDVFCKPNSLPPYRMVNGSCNLKPGCQIPPRAGVGRLSKEEIDYTKQILTDYLQKGWIRPSYSRTAARLFFVKKPNGSLRSVVDYRNLNEVLETQYFPPPEWTNIVNQLGDAQIYTTFDCTDFFVQNRMRDEDCWLTAFATAFGNFEWRVCPQGLASSPAVAQRLFSNVLQSLPCVNDDLSKHPKNHQNLLGENATVFLDDALLHGGDFNEHLRYIYSFLYAMREQKLHLSPEKTQFMRDRCNYLGHVPRTAFRSSQRDAPPSETGQSPRRPPSYAPFWASACTCDATSRVLVHTPRHSPH